MPSGTSTPAGLPGSPTWQHQRDTYGPDAAYDDFVTAFDEGAAGADMAAIAAVARDAGAGYDDIVAKNANPQAVHLSWSSGLVR